jgi:hypothetical protein
MPYEQAKIEKKKIHIKENNRYRQRYARAMVFSTTVNNMSALSWRSVLLVEENGVPEENHRPAACH